MSRHEHEHDPADPSAAPLALPPDYFELRCLMLDQFLLSILDLHLDPAAAAAMSIDALKGRIHRSANDADAIYSIAFGLLARHAPEALARHRERAARLAERRHGFEPASSEDHWFLDDLRWIAQKLPPPPAP